MRWLTLVPHHVLEHLLTLAAKRNYFVADAIRQESEVTDADEPARKHVK